MGSDPELQPQALGRRYALPLAATSIFLMAANGGLGLIVKLFLQEQGFSPLVIGLVTSVNAAGVLIGSMLWGRMSDRSSRRPLLFIATLGVAAAIGILAFLPPATVVLGSSFVRTFMRMGFTTVTLALISGISIESRRGKNLSYVTSARSLGMAIGSMAAGFIIEELGFRGAFFLMACLPLIGSLFLLLLPHEKAPTLPVRRSSWRLALSAGLTDLYLGTILRQIAINGVFALLAVYIASLGVALKWIGLIAALNTGTQVLALLVFGRLADRVGRRRIFMLGFALSALAPAVFASTTHIWAMMGGYITMGLSFGSLYIGSTAYIGDRVPQDQQGSMFGLYETSRGIGGMLGPIIAGVITPLVGYRGMFLVMAAIAGLGFLVMTNRRRRPASS
ncbi:MFS transporter [Candidatus Bipolaricaulota bacterium]